ncbi:MAG: cytochrome c [Pseudomonadales bacterium]|nr:cytochrome c [Pseudomonadales bacterium]
MKKNATHWPPFTLFVFLCLALRLEIAGADTLPSIDRHQELEYLLKQDCGSCHGMRLKGGLGPSLLPEALAGKSEIYLKQVIRKGIPGTAMPPWEKFLSEQDIDYLVLLLAQQPTHPTEATSEVNQ